MESNRKSYFCKIVNSPADLDFERTSWSGDMLEVCEYCRVSPWDKKFEESHQKNVYYTIEEQLKKVQEEVKVMTKMYLTLRHALERVRSNYKSDIPICYDFVEAIELTLSEHDNIVLNLKKKQNENL